MKSIWHLKTFLTRRRCCVSFFLRKEKWSEERKEKWNVGKIVEIDIPKTESWCATFRPVHTTRWYSENYLIIKPLGRWQQFHCCDTTKRSTIRTTDRKTHKLLNTTIIRVVENSLGNWKSIDFSSDPIGKSERQRKFDWMSMMTMLGCRLM